MDNALDFEPAAAPTQGLAPQPNTNVLDFEPKALDFEPVQAVPQMSGYPGQPKVSQEELDSASPIGVQPQATTPVFNGTFDPSKDESLIPGSTANIAAEQDRGLAKQYENYQSGPLAGNSLGPNFKPTTDMYDNSKNPWKLYKDATKQADSSTIFGDPVIKGVRVPKPGEYDWTGLDKGLSTSVDTGDISPKIKNLVGDAGREGIKNLLVTGAAALDEISGTDTMAKTVDSWIASPPIAQKSVDSLIKDATKITAGAIVGAKVGAMGAKSMGATQTISNAIAGLSSIVGATGVLNPNDPTLITGQNALAPILHGVPVDKNGKFSTQIINNKVNQLIDGILLVAPAAKAVDAVAWVGSFINRVAIQPVYMGLPMAEKAREMKVGRDILYHLDGTTDKATDDLIKSLQQYKSETFDMGNLGVAEIERTPMSAIAEGATVNGNPLLANKAMEVEAGGLRSGISPLITKKEQPLGELNRVLGETVDSRGGLETVDKTRQLMADEAINRLSGTQNAINTVKSSTEADVNAVKQTADLNLSNAKTDVKGKTSAAQGELDNVNNELDKIYKEDPTFAATIDQLSKDSGIDVANRFRTGEVKKLLPEIVNSVKVMKDKKNALYEAIPEDVNIDIQSFTDKVAPVLENDWLPKKVEQSIASKLGTEDEPLENLDFRFVYKDLLPKINGEIGREINLGVNANREKISALQDLSRNISQDQVDTLSRSPDEAVAKAATAARDFYKNTYIKYTRDSETPIGRLFHTFDESFDDHLASINPDTKDIIGLGDNYKMADVAQNTIETGVNDKRMGTSQQVIDFMNNPDYKGDKSGLMKVYKGEVAGAIGDQLALNGGDISKIDPSLVYKTLSDKGVVLKQNFPQQTKEIEDFITKFKNGRMSKVEAEKALEQVQKEGTDTISSVTSQNKELISSAKAKAKSEVKAVSKAEGKDFSKSVLNKFIEKTPEGMKAKQNGFDIFKGILNKNNNENKIAEIAQRVKDSGDLEAQKGLEAAWFAHVEDSLHATVNDKKFNVTNAKKLLSDKTSLMKYGKMIFGNHSDPVEAQHSLEALDVYSRFIDGVIKEQTKTSSTSIPLGDKLHVESEATSAFGYVTKFVFGALSKVGLKTSSTGGRILKYSNPDEHARQVRDKLLSDPDYAMEVFGIIRDQMKAGLSPEVKKALRISAVAVAKQKLGEGGKDIKDYLAPPNLK